MCHKFPCHLFFWRVRDQGFSLVSAIFLLVIIAGLGVFMVSIYLTQQTNSSQDVLGARGYQAAKAGIEWGAYQVLNLENAVVPVAPYACPVGSTVLPAFAGALQKFTVSVSCSVTTTTEGGNTIRVYQFTSTANYGVFPSPDFVERQLVSKVNTCRIGPGAVATCT